TPRPLERLQQDPLLAQRLERHGRGELQAACVQVYGHIAFPSGPDAAFTCRRSGLSRLNLGTLVNHVKGLMEPIERRRELEEGIRRRMREWALERLRLTMVEIAEKTGESYKNVQNWMAAGKTMPAA